MQSDLLQEQRQDLAVLATSYWGNLKMRKDKLVEEADFHYVVRRPVKARRSVATDI